MKIRDILNEVDKYVDREVCVYGWMRNQRFGKNVGFIELNDGTTFKNLQVVVGSDIENYDELDKQYLSTSLEVKGVLVKTGNSKNPYEIQAKVVNVLGESSEKFLSKSKDKH